MDIQLINVGRQNVSKRVQVKDLDGALIEVSKYLMSKNVELVETEERGTFDVVVGGLRTVGQIKVLEGLLQFLGRSLGEDLDAEEDDEDSWDEEEEK